MKLRTHVNLIVGSLSAVFIVLMMTIELDRTRRAVHEEIAAASIVAARLLGRVAQSYGGDAGPSVQAFLRQLGRVRANEIALRDADGEILYRSPPATYKAGREAPAWFRRLLLPPTRPQVFALAGGGELVVEANASLAILDGWDDMLELLWVGGLAFAAINALVFWLVSRAVAPLPVIASGLRRIEQGDLSYRLPPLRGLEASAMSAAFNHMALAVEEKWQAERKAREAEARLQERRELDQLIEQRLDEERRLIARELHDEFAQSVTAIRSLAVVIASQNAGDSRSAEVAQLISAEAARLYDAMHGLIPRLAPLALDTLGLAETLEGFIREWQRRHPALAFTLRHELSLELGASITLAIYRIVQEAVINAVRHAQPSQVDVEVDCTLNRVLVKVADDGVGLREDWQQPGRFGLRGLQERVAMLDGEFMVRNRTSRGVEVVAEIPLGASA